MIEKALRADPRRARAAYLEYLAVGSFVSEDYAAAVKQAENAAQRAGYLLPLRIMLAVFHALLGQPEKAHAHVQAVLEAAPDAAIPLIRRPPFKNQRDVDRYIDGLRKAGFPG